MEHYTEIPEELYGRWLGVINEEYGEIIQSDETNIQGKSQEAEIQKETQLDNTTKTTQERSGPSQVRSSQSRQIPLKKAFVSKSRSIPKSTQETAKQNAHYQKPSRQQDVEQGPKLSRQEEENLSEYLDLGMSIDEARDTFKKEIEMAELRAKICENQRNRNRGEIGSANRTQIGHSSSSRGTGRGGLAFN